MKRNTPLLLSALAAAALLGGYTHARSVIDRTRRLDQLRATLDATPEPAAGRPSPDHLESLRRQADLLTEPASELNLTSDVLGVLTDDLDELGTRDQTWAIGMPSHEGEHELIPIDLTFRGTLPGVYELLQRIDNYPRFTRVEKLSIKRSPRADNVSIDVSMHLLTFVTVEGERAEGQP